MSISRRQFVVGAGAGVLAPVAIRTVGAIGAVGPHPSTRTRNRLVVVFLFGGNDGLNTVVPRGDVRGAPRYSVYRKVRPEIAYLPNQVLPLDRPDDRSELMGLNAQLRTVHNLYKAGRLAIVQGVDYPNHNYSHFESADIWQSGTVEYGAGTGWLGRHLDRAGIGEGELRGVGIGRDIPLILRGQKRSGIGIASIGGTTFRDGAGGAADAAHKAFAGFGRHPAAEPIRHFAGRQAASTVAVVDTLRQAPRPPQTQTDIAASMLTARVLLEQDLGVECVFLTTDGYDTHTGQRALQERLLRDLDQGVEAFYNGTIGGQPLGVGNLKPDVANRTLIMVVSEFGRRIGENGGGDGAGTDHGAAAPVLMIGPPGKGSRGRRLVGGLHGHHPKMGTTALPADNLAMTVDLRRVYESVLRNWLGTSDPAYGKRYPALGGLFA